MPSIEDSWSKIRLRMAEAAKRAGRAPDSVHLLAVSKAQSPERVLELAALGQRDFGENYVQEWLQKRDRIAELAPTLAAELRWHFIGHLQSNKASLVAGQVSLLHSVDSLKLARKISDQGHSLGFRQASLFEVKLAAENSKSGLSPEALLMDLKNYSTLPGIAWRGLMTVPPASESTEETRPYFIQLKSLLDECNRTGFFENPMTELSMGMSHDFEIAIAAGATWIRVGTALFGPRPS